MDYKEKYEMALEGIQEILGSGEDSIKMSRLQLRLQGIFPELKESEDEKIRKELLNHLKEASYGKTLVVSTLDYKRWADWLEKQGTQKPDAWSEEDEDILNTIINHFEIDLECTENDDITKWLKSLKDRVQPKQEWGEEDEKKRNLLINIINVNHPNEYFKVNPANTLNMEAIHTKELVDWLKSLEYRIVSQPKQEWSEKDEVKDNWEYIQDFIEKLGHFPKDSDELDVLINYVLSKKQKSTWSEGDEDTIEKAICVLEANFNPNEVFLGLDIKRYQLVDKLKSLKDRVQPQPKWEWSEEDKAILEKCIGAVKVSCYSQSFKSEAENWLNSLKDRYTWKPSDEHYELEEFAKIVRGNLTGISKDVQKLFESKYLQLTGNKMYGGFKD